MLPLVALGLALYFLSKHPGSAPERTAAGQAKGWSILLQGPAALPQAAVPELRRAFGIHTVKTAFLASPQAGANVLTVITPDVLLAQIGQNINVMGVPLVVRAIQPAPIS